MWRHNTWHHDTHHNDIQPKHIVVPIVIYAKCRKKALVLRLIMLTVIMLSVYAEYCDTQHTA